MVTLYGSKKVLHGAFSLNLYSPQAANLMNWWPMIGSAGSKTIRDFGLTPINGVSGTAVEGYDHVMGSTWISTDPNQIDLGVSSSFIPASDELTISLWAYQTGGDTNSHLFSFQRTSGVKTIDIARFTNNTRVQARYRDGTDTAQSLLAPNNTLSTTELNHICLCCGQSDVRLYVNGNLIVSDIDFDTTNSFNFSTGNTYIGQWPSNRGWEGPITDVRFYDRALSALEVENLYRDKWDLYKPITARPWLVVAPTGGGFSINVSDSITVSEAVTLALSDLLLNASDSITVSEAVQTLLVNLVNVSDSVAVTETIGVLLVNLVNVSDSITVSEAISALLINLLNVSDSITVSEAIKPSLISLINVSDNITVSEAINVLIQIIGGLSINVSDSVTVSEFVALQLSDLLLNVSDNITVSEAVNIFIQVIGTLSVNVSDNITVSEAIKPLLINLISTSDSITVSEVVNPLLINLVSVSDAITVSEAIKPLLINLVSVSDSITVSEAVITQMGDLLISVADNITVSEAVNALIIVAGIFGRATFKSMFKGMWRNMQ